MIIATVVVLIYLDKEIRERFAGNVQTQPAHVYARPLALRAGSLFTKSELAQVFNGSGYRAVTQLSAPGEFVASENFIDIYIREFYSTSDHQNPVAVRIKFNGNKIAALTDHGTAQNIPKVVIEPQLIGSLQLGSYKDRIALKLHEMPELLIKALLAMEDRNFESHIGVDPKSILRALWSNIREGRTIQGGSTLTQQLVKNLFLDPTRSLSRKITEALMAIVMEIRFSKSDILELYLNEIFLGQSGNRAVHGFALASEYYFGRPVSQLKLHESALLIGMIPAPSYYNPRKHPDRALKRRNLVLKTLANVGAINSLTAENLGELPLGIIKHKSDSSSDFPAYLDYLHRQLRQYYSEEVLRTNGLKLYTSLDSVIQNVAQRQLDETLLALEKQKGFKSGTLQGAIIIVNPALGEIVSLVGDRVKGYSGFNRAIDAERPIGSLVKPAVYLSALEQPRKYSLTTILDDSPLTLTPAGGEPWSPQNYDKKFRGALPLYQGLIRSYNLPTVRLGLEVGVDTVIDTLHRLGIERDIANFPSTILGASQHTPLEIAQMYQTLANNGVRIPLRSIRNIKNHRGETIANFPLSEYRAIDQDSAYLIDFALKQVVAQGTAAGLNQRFDRSLSLGGKTGTTDNFRDSWFAGYSGNLLGVVWLGRDDNKPIKLSGSSGAMRVWSDVMSQIKLEPSPTIPSNNIISVSIDPQSGLVANYRCASQQDLPFIQGSQPLGFAPCSGLMSKLKSWFGISRGVVVETLSDPSLNRP